MKNYTLWIKNRESSIGADISDAGAERLKADFRNLHEGVITVHDEDGELLISREQIIAVAISDVKNEKKIGI